MILKSGHCYVQMKIDTDVSVCNTDVPRPTNIVIIWVNEEHFW